MLSLTLYKQQHLFLDTELTDTMLSFSTGSHQLQKIQNCMKDCNIHLFYLKLYKGERAFQDSRFIYYQQQHYQSCTELQIQPGENTLFKFFGKYDENFYGLKPQTVKPQSCYQTI